ncbi:MAG: DUF853 family protein [Bacteroidetes bacterium]|nr:DUF853 family protein [Bacteroidota bacterium]
MDVKQSFIEKLALDYTFKGASLHLGAAILNGECLSGSEVKIPLKTLNRHGLIAGATGTGKTKTLQNIAEGLSKNGIPVLMMDIKGDLSGIAQAGSTNPKIEERSAKIGVPFQPASFPVELLSISQQNGVRLRATVSEFGPVLFSKILELNDTQQGVVALVYKYADDKQLPLVDLKDFKKLLNYVTNDGKAEITEAYGAISTATSGTILRKIVELEQQGAELFFGEKSFDVEDLTRIDENGKGIISIMRLTDIQDKPKLFSTFMLSLLAEVYATFPEEGDLDQPKLVVFIDEAHLIFKEASKALQDQIESIIKLIRSKGVGIFFCTQNPSDIPSAVLSQLGLKVQHALRAFTAVDRKMIKLTAENYPITDFYKTDELLTSLGIGEAAITALNEKGNPTMLVATLLCPPTSRMDILNEAEISSLIAASPLVKKYAETIDRESAFEMLNAKIKNAVEQQEQTEVRKPQKQEKTTFEKIIASPVTRSIGVTVAGALTRGLLGALGLGGRSSKKKSSFF